ncbi:MAG TPA: DinB family protein [Clostridia bacterium]|nr:DinB family protein [Clostridia bacterium]
MTEVTRIADQLRRAFEGPAWSGPCLLEVVQGLTAAEAARHAGADAHSMWEIVLHVGAWHDIVRRRLEGETIANVTDEEDWPQVADTSNGGWTEAIARLKASYAALHAAVLAHPFERLSTTVPGKDYSFYVMLHGAAQHDLYHAGQIALLRKFAGPQ